MLLIYLDLLLSCLDHIKSYHFFIRFAMEYGGLGEWGVCRITIHVLQLNKEKAETSILC